MGILSSPCPYHQPITDITDLGNHIGCVPAKSGRAEDLDSKVMRVTDMTMELSLKVDVLAFDVEA